MFDLIQMLFWAIVAFVILVAVHEYGHFWVARKLGVKVLRFSIGFGRVVVPDLYRFRVLVLDGAGNEVTAFGEYGNMDNGKKDPSLGCRYTDAWMSMAGMGDVGGNVVQVANPAGSGGVVRWDQRPIQTAIDNAQPGDLVLVEEGTIATKDLELFEYVETAEEAWEKISEAVGL